MKTGMSPLDPSQVLQWLPDTTNEQPENVQDRVLSLIC